MQGVSRKFQEFFKEVSGRCNGCFMEISRVLLVRLKGVSGSFKGVSRDFERSLKGGSGKFLGCLKEVSKKFEGSFKSVSGKF